MATVKIYLKDPKATGKTRLRFVICDGRQVNIKFYTDISIDPKDWDHRNQRVKPSNDLYLVYNKHLHRLMIRIMECYLEAKDTQKKITYQSLKQMVWRK